MSPAQRDAYWRKSEAFPNVDATKDIDNRLREAQRQLANGGP